MVFFMIRLWFFRLTVQLSAHPAPRFMWFVNGVIIEPSQRYKITYENGIVTLFIYDAKPQDSGEYVLKASNELGEITCKTVLTIARKCTVIPS